MKLKKTVATLSALAQETRLRIFRELVKSHSPDQNLGGLPPGVLTKKLNVSASTLSFHLKEMNNAGLINSRREGQSIIYKADLTAMQSLIDTLLNDCCGGACGVTVEEQDGV